MGNILGRQRPLKEVLREQKRTLNKAIRELEREITQLQQAEKKLTADIKKAAKENQMGAVRIMAKDLVRTRQYTTKFIEMKTHLNAVMLKLQTIKSHEALASAMKGVVKAMQRLNKQVNLPQLQKIMADFERENERAEFMQEAMGDAIDDAMEDETSAEEEERVVGQVLAEIGIGVGDVLPEAATGMAERKEQEEEKVPENDPAMVELEARLNNLRR